MKPQCTTGKNRRITRWEHEDTLDVVQERLDGAPEAMKLRRQTVEHVFGTLKAWMGPSHFLTKTLLRVRTEMSLTRNWRVTIAVTALLAHHSKRFHTSSVDKSRPPPH